MTYYGLPEEPITRNPWLKGEKAYDWISNVNNAIVGGAWANKRVAEIASFMSPEEAAYFNQWAVAHPTVNPRTWVPLAGARMDPYSSEATAVAQEDIAAAAYRGAYDKTIGERRENELPPGATADPVAAEEEDDNPWGPDWIRDAIPDVATAMIPGGAATFRVGMAGLMAPIQMGEAAVRQSLGDNNREEMLKDALGKKLDLTPDQMDAVEDARQSGASMGVQLAPGVYSGADNTPEEQADAAYRYFLEQGFDEDTAERMKVAFEGVQNGYKIISDDGGSYVSQAFGQTDLGVVAASMVDGVEGNYITHRPEDGSKFDPKTKKWLNPDGSDANWVQHGGVFLPSQVQAETEYAAIRAYDIRTAEEIKNGVAPVAWTLGRGVAHKFYDADETAFYTLSGVVDFGKSLFLDPTNLIPVGWAADAARGATLAGRAFSGAGDNIVVATRAAQFGPGGVRLPAANSWARPGSVIGAKNLADEILDEGSQATRTILDDSLAGRDWLLSNERPGVPVKQTDEGLVNMPHTKFVVKDAAWRWLNSTKGGRVINALVDETSAVKIWNKSNQKLDMDVAVKLADARTPEEVRAILGTRIGFDITSARDLGKIGGPSPLIGRVPVFGDTLYRGLSASGKDLEGSGLLTKRGRSVFSKMNDEYGYMGAVRSLYREPFRLAPSSGVGFSVEDTQTAAEELTRFLWGTRVPREVADDIVEQVIRAPNGAARYNAVYAPKTGVLATIEKRIVDEMGFDESVAHEVTRAFSSGFDDSKRLFFNTDMGDLSYGAKTADGAQGRSMLAEEALGLKVYLPDYRTLRRVTGTVGRLSKSSPDAAIAASRVADYMTLATSAWRNLVLARPAYTIREVGEMAFSMSLAGGQGAFTHPFGFIAMASQAAMGMHVHTLLGRVTKNMLSAPMRAAGYTVDELGRVLVRNGDELDGWKQFAHMPDAERPPMLRGLSEQGIEDLWHSLRPKQRNGVIFQGMNEGAREAFREWMLFDEGLKWLMPHVNSRWARVNGQRMWDELWKAADGDEAAYQRFQYELNHVGGNLLIDEPAIRGATRNLRQVLRDDELGRRAYAKILADQKFSPMANDFIFRQYAGGMDADTLLPIWRGTDDWLLRREMRRDLWGNPKDLDTPPNLQTVNELDDLNYLSAHQSMFNALTKSDPELLKIIRSRKYKGKPINGQNKAFVDLLESKLADPMFRERLPEVLHDFPYKGTLASGYQRAINHFFTMTGDISDLMARSPMARKFYVDRVLELGDELSPSARKAIVANLRKAGDTKFADKVAATGRRGKQGTLTLDEVDGIASGYTLKKMRQTFYNAHRRQNYAVAMRTIFPFIQSVMNTFKRWGAMTLQNPQLAYRTLKPIEALRDPGSAVIYEILGSIAGDDGMAGLYSPGHPEASVDGFFFHNQYGDRVFAFPMVREAYNALAAVVNTSPVGPEMTPVPEGNLALARASNLNVAGTSLNPGFGPMLTLPFAVLMHESVYQDNTLGSFMRSMFPYGLPNDESALRRAWESVLPTMFRRSIISPDDQANLAAKLIPTLMATGNYDLTSPNSPDARVLLNDAKELAGRTNLFAGLFGAALPTTFNWAQAIDVTDGDKYGTVRAFMMQDRLSAEFREYTAPRSPESAADDYSNGVLRFLKDYGLYAFYSVQPRTYQKDVDISVAPTADVWSFRTEEPEAYDKYRSVIGIFFPGGDPVGEWSTGEENLYAWQKASGERPHKDVEQFWRDANVSLGWIMYGAATRQLATMGIDPDEQSVIKAQIESDVEEKFPGWTNEPIDTGDYNRALGQIELAIQDETMQTLPGTPFIATYMEAREDTIQGLRERGYVGTLSADYAAIERANLAALAGRLAAEDSSGTFAYAYGRFFSGELETD